MQGAVSGVKEGKWLRAVPTPYLSLQPLANLPSKLLQDLRLIPASYEELPKGMKVMAAFEVDGALVPLQQPLQLSRGPDGSSYTGSGWPGHEALLKGGQVSSVCRCLPSPPAPSTTAAPTSKRNTDEPHPGLLVFEVRPDTGPGQGGAGRGDGVAASASAAAGRPKEEGETAQQPPQDADTNNQEAATDGAAEHVQQGGNAGRKRRRTRHGPPSAPTAPEGDADPHPPSHQHNPVAVAKQKVKFQVPRS
jgi:hypothetical protein